MNPNDNKNNHSGGKNSSNWRGILSLVCWALLLTIIINSATAYLGSAGHQASSSGSPHNRQNSGIFPSFEYPPGSRTWAACRFPF